MAGLPDYVPSLALGTKVSTVTGNYTDGFVSGGFAAFMYSISGENPSMVTTSPGHVQLVLSKKQIIALQQFMDKELKTAFRKPGVPSTLDISLGPAIIPWALKFAIPAAILLLVAGWFAHSYFGR